jgi:hypothetical protein
LNIEWLLARFIGSGEGACDAEHRFLMIGLRAEDQIDQLWA